MVTLDEVKINISDSRKKRRHNAHSILRKLTKILIEKYHVNKIVLIGSLLDDHRFGFQSDIDLCVEGLSDKDYFQAVGDVLLAAGEFDVDIIKLEDVERKMKHSIRKGKIIYEKK
jgi:predicted nucleotidyltransferase